MERRSLRLNAVMFYLSLINEINSGRVYIKPCQAQCYI